mmetsp:Transcript_5199/g.12765  ORF Transcript_5199/g.12765 Transcript_5199/m.12765 type:complete len:658 (+) Transcript_5199:35-2008(+)|eukprot:CAMPEP_0172392764 /NCGR_PEP_ID=MMETSP1061-20121228/8792_1 /TAXON_ID=37318 /ORGANISM="Pseudo-nitzschia pungens, Strain cf. pungens" /LENGTH=657 /DNA_ID=CAMNT_0013123663 /DNA_START=114 /DNA_END=2087 /DNA_ORIENTATION=-
MYRIAERIVRHRELEEDWDDSDDYYDDGERRYQPPPARKQPGRRVKIMVETNDAALKSNTTDFVRNRSSDTHTTHTTENSSGIFSLKLLREIYPSFSECESESENAIFYDNDNDNGNDNDNEIEIENHNDNHNDNDADWDLSLASMIYKKYVPSNNRINLVSQWAEDKPFDEESQRAMSEAMPEGGDVVQNNEYSKAFPNVKEYILPPARGSDILVDVTPRDHEPYDIVKKSSRNTTSTEPMVHALPGDSAAGDSADIDEAVSRSFSSSAANEENKSHRNRKSCILVCLLIFLLVAGILVTGILLAQSMKIGNNPNNQASAATATATATAASSDATDIPTAQEGNESTTDSTTESTLPDTESVEETISPSPNVIPTTPGNDEEERPVAFTIEPTAEATAEATAEFTTEPTTVPTTVPTTAAVRTTLAPTTAPRPWNDNFTPMPTNPPTESRTWSTLVNYMDPIPESFFPLGQCMGDCDRDDDCAEGLVCFQRNPNEPVPFCYGGENDFTRTDYCTFPTYETNPPPAEQEEEAIECPSSVSVVPECYFWTENVLVVEFNNCNPRDEDWIGVFPDGTAFDDESSAMGWVGDDYIDWAFTCGSTGCSGSPTANSFAFPTNGNPAYDLASLRVYLLRNTRGGPPFEILAQSEPFAPTKTCQ